MIHWLAVEKYLPKTVAEISVAFDRTRRMDEVFAATGFAV